MRSGRRPARADEADRLRTMGAAGILTRDEVTAEGRPLESERWAGAVDAVGGATLPYVLRTLKVGAAVASSGNAGGAGLQTTVFPFILRGAALLGMDSVNMPIARRRELWDRLATDLRPPDLGRALHRGHPRHARRGPRRDRRRGRPRPLDRPDRRVGQGTGSGELAAELPQRALEGPPHLLGRILREGRRGDGIVDASGRRDGHGGPARPGR